MNNLNQSQEKYLMAANQAQKRLISFAIAVNPKYEAARCHRMIAAELEHIEQYGDKDYKVLLVIMPPRHGKSELCSILFPAWYLGRNPDKEIITISYSSELAQDFGGKTRTLINDEAYKLIFNLKLKEDEQAKAKWKTDKGGSYTSTGVGGSITGRGANCFPAGTLITTEQGQLPIESCKYGTRVLSYNHDRNTTEWKTIKGTLRRRKNGFIEITTTSGRKIKSTREHPIFILGKGYAEAQTLKQGEGIGILQIGQDTISSITSTDEELDVYDIEVEDNHNFFANEILVHNCLLFDDPIKNREEAESEVYRNKVWQFFTSTAFTRLEPNGVVIVILTRWHIDDLAGRILENEELKGKCKIIHFKAIEEGKALWPERYDLNVLEGIRNTIGPYDFAALYQGSPIISEKQEFKPEWYKYITEEELGNKRVNRYLTIDTAFSKKDQADYCGFCENSIDKENFWNLKAWRARLNADELIDILFSLQENRHYTSIGIEKTAYTEGLKPFLDSEQRRRNRFLPIKMVEHRQVAKELRIRGLVPRYASGSVRHVKGQCSDLEEEQFNFPFGKNDDVLDALAYQMQIVDNFIDLTHPRIPQGDLGNPGR